MPMNDNRTLKKINTKLDGVRRVGRPKMWWEDGVDQDRRILEVKNWKKVALDRYEWANLLKKASKGCRANDGTRTRDSATNPVSQPSREMWTAVSGWAKVK
jgi:hypothetical protein